MSRTRTRLGALVTAGVLTFGLAACGSDDEPDTTTPATTVDEGTDATDDTAATGAATDEDTTEEETTEETDTGDASGETIPVEEFLAMVQAPGEEMLSSYTMTMELDLEDEQTTMEGAVDLSGDAPRMQMTMAVPELGEMDIIFADGEAYMSMPGLTPEGMYLLAPEELLGDTAELGEADVSAQWEVWEEGAQEVRLLGEEDVDGQQMRRYQVTVDAQAVLDASAGDDAAATSMGLEDEVIVYDVWLDEDDLMRKMAFDMEGETLEMFMDNWGEPQEIQVPEPDQVMDWEQMGTGSGG